MSVPVSGPRKLVLIESGVYPYAEIELEESVHLSGPNNSGKTTMLNALQFLYIDDINLMHFPQSNFDGKTRPFYFKPHGKSTILVEADTRWGIRTVGMHGLGATAGCAWQRFGFDGPYVKDDFVDPETGRPRDWDQVKALLAPKNYTEMTQAQLRSSLRGTGEKVNFRLELVPGAARYDTFIEVFRQLLTLRKSKPEELKKLLISVEEPRLRSGDDRNRGVVSLPSVVGEDYIRTLAASKSYERVCQVERLGRALLEDYDHMVALRDSLPGQIQAVYVEASARVKDRRSRAEEARARAVEAREQLDELKSERDRLLERKEHLIKEEGHREKSLTTAQDAARWIAEESRELMDRALGEAQSVAAQLQSDLASLTGIADPSSALRQRASGKRKDADALRDIVRRLREREGSSPTQSWMGILAEYPLEERAPLLKLINPSLLDLEEGAGGMQVVDPSEVGALVDAVRGATRDGIFSGMGVRIRLDALPTPDIEDPMSKEEQIGRYLDQIETLEKDAKRLNQLAEQSRSRESLTESLGEANRRVQDQVRAISRFDECVALAEQIPTFQETLDGTRAELKLCREASENLEDQIQESIETERQCHGQARRLEDEAVKLHAVAHSQDLRALALDLPIEDAAVPEKPGMGEDEFEQAVDALDTDWNEAQRLQAEVTTKLESAEGILDGMIAGDQEAKIEKIRDLLDGLEDQKADLDEKWRHIAVAAKTSFVYLLQDFETIESLARRLNRRMGRFAVSNLSEIQLRLVPNEERMSILREFTREGLFADAGMAEKAKDKLGKLISEGRVFRLSEMFSVQLEVTKDGEKEIYSSLDAESTGTAITLKVVFLAHLLKDLYDSRSDVRLLIFVDEVDTLDDENQETIRACARELGFTLIMASPNPANACRLYFLRREGKVTYIYPDEALEVVFKGEPDGLEAEGVADMPLSARDASNVAESRSNVVEYPSNPSVEEMG